MAAWIGVDLDGTLAIHERGEGIESVGEPIMPMVARIRRWLKQGLEVRVCTARVSSIYSDAEAQRIMIEKWCLDNIGQALPVTCEKDGEMLELWDDRAVAVERNTGKALTPSRFT